MDESDSGASEQTGLCKCTLIEVTVLCLANIRARNSHVNVQFIQPFCHQMYNDKEAMSSCVQNLVKGIHLVVLGYPICGQSWGRGLQQETDLHNDHDLFERQTSVRSHCSFGLHCWLACHAPAIFPSQYYCMGRCLGMLTCCWGLVCFAWVGSFVHVRRVLVIHFASQMVKN